MSKQRYNGPYRLVRTALQRAHRAGYLTCVRCGKPILPTQNMDVGHVDGDPSRIAGPEHANSRDCPAGGNRATARHAAERRRSRTCSRQW